MFIRWGGGRGLKSWNDWLAFTVHTAELDFTKLVKQKIYNSQYVSVKNKQNAKSQNKSVSNYFVYLNFNRNFNNIVFLFQENSTINEFESKVIISQTGLHLIWFLSSRQRIWKHEQSYFYSDRSTLDTILVSS